jgi:Fur family zinc uptake transcriptional regulator
MKQHTHNHEACLNNAAKNAELLCNDLGVRLTPIRRRVLELVWSTHKAAKAYDILQQLDAKDGSLAPPTVYRALDFLLEKGLVHKVESQNGFIACSHPLKQHRCQFLICTECEYTKEFCNDDIVKLIKKNTKQTGFTFTKAILEVYGICAECTK